MALTSRDGRDEPTRFSFVIPVYNVAPYLRECLDSLVVQTCSDWEAVCVDDGSTDGSGAILDEYAARDSRFHVVHQPNAGVGAARNKALALAAGEWLIFADGDDVVRADALTRVANIIKRMPDINVVAFRQVKFADGESPDWISDESVVRLDIARKLPSEIGSVGICTVALRRRDFQDIKFKSFALGEDLVFLLECFARTNAAALAADVLYAYRQRNGSAVHLKMDAARIVQLIDYFEAASEIIENSGKSVGRVLARTRGNDWIEKCAALIWLCRGGGKDALWRRWFDSMKIARKTKCLSPWQKFVASSVAATRSKVVSTVLCVLPYGLKKMGLHR